MFGALEHGAQFDGVGVLHRRADLAEFFNQMIECAADLFLVLQANLRPHLRWAAGDAREILEPRSDKIQRMRAVAADNVDYRRRDDVRKMTDSRDNLVVLLRKTEP